VIQDLDDRFRGVAELLTASGKYFWVPWKSIRSLDFAKPERPMDLVWRKATIEVEGGPDGEVFMPVRYPNPAAWGDEEKLGRGTQWLDSDLGSVTGVGQRMIFIEDDGIPIMELGRLTMELPEA
jgi:type VI secretion system protein ImpE